ncbi:MAG: zinc metallopeptidase [Chloroflexota bacterium]|nr:zinc metallopeptidase [Chloroflexota bacterium]
MFLGWNPTYWVFALPALVLALIAQFWVQSAFRKYQRVPNGARATGVEVARRLMRMHGLGVNIESAGNRALSDHYDPRGRVLRLSVDVATRASVASMAIVAHELGHAQQDMESYPLFRLRAGLVPMVNFTSWLGPILFLAGMFFNSYTLSWLGIFAFAGAVLFALVTLPVEIDASRRGLRLLEQSGLFVSAQEKKGTRRILTAAALTYVAALAQAFSNLLYYVFLLRGRRRR